MLLRILATLLALVLSSCVIQRQVPFNEAAVRWSAATGTGAISGRVFAVMRDDSERIARNIYIYLAPADPYFTEDINIAFGQNRKLSPGDPRAEKYIRKTGTNDEGEFQFHNLPAGQYFVGTDVEWRHSYFDGDNNEVSILEVIPIYAKVTVRPGQTVKLSNYEDWTYGKQRSH